MEESSNLFVAGLIMAVAIALHNVPEGMVIGAMYVGVDPASLTSGSGFIMAVTIGLHNIPEGMSVAVPLIAGGMNRGKAVAITALSGFPTVLGAMLGYWAGSLGPVMNALALSFASGAMLYVVFGELLPESYLMWKSKAPALGIMGGLLLGMLLIL
jgi:ZIP family zinc transporter